MANLFWTHPDGDTQTIPCVHRRQQHPGGDSITTPCTHPYVQQHSNDVITTPIGDKTVPCIHLVRPHPGGDTVTVPCTHLVQEHPNDTINGPCVHPMTPVRYELNGNLVFFTNNSVIQTAALDAVNRLRALGVDLAAPRPLNIFFRRFIRTADDSDAFWHHYEPLTHSIQIMDNNQSAADLKAALRHEMGHALMGHRCVQLATQGGPHGITQQLDPGTAMSEGWADFVAVVLGNARGAVAPAYMGMNWETQSVAPQPNVEYCVGCCLWDLYDTHADLGDTAGVAEQFSFKQLFGVFSPNFQTLLDGPVINGVKEYLHRLAEIYPAKRAQIASIALRNVALSNF